MASESAADRKSRPSGVSPGSRPGVLELESGTAFHGTTFGAAGGASGEVVFNTGMVGYQESLTDPSYRGQILVLTYPLVGNYGVVRSGERSESDRIQVRGLVVPSCVREYSHWQASLGLDAWLREEGVPGLEGVDTRALTRVLREKGTMRGRMSFERGAPFHVEDPNATDLVREVTCREVSVHDPPGEANGKHVVLVDCGCKRSIRDSLLRRGFRVMLVPYDHDLVSLPCDGMLVSNGPGDPAVCRQTVRNVARVLATPDPVPVAGICLGCQILALAAGGRTFKLPYGHRSQNQPCREAGRARGFITSQNHGFAVDAASLPEGWDVWMTNLNDGTVEGIRHRRRPFRAVQFHPEASPGPTDAAGFFDDFARDVKGTP